MIDIKFTAAEELDDVKNAALVYSGIWRSEGEIITNFIEAVTGLGFKGNNFFASIQNSASRSKPLQLDARYKSFGKRSTLIHELMHILLYQNGLDRNEVGGNSLESHKKLDLVLYDVWDEIYGKSFADEALEREKKWGKMYEEAWNWALTFTKEKRKEEFEKLKNG